MWVNGSGASIINTDQLERVMVKHYAGKKAAKVIAVMTNGDKVPLAHFTSEGAYENAVALARQFVLEISGQDHVVDAKTLCIQAKKEGDSPQRRKTAKVGLNDKLKKKVHEVKGKIK
jgi:hypothetical protein